MKKLFLLLLTFLMILIPLNVMAVPFEYIRIGDIDGFGYGTGLVGAPIGGPGYTAANGGSVNTDSSGLLYGGDFLPDLNLSGGVVTGSHDDFDNRDGSETSDLKFSAIGASMGTGMDGSDFTDIALSTSYDTSSLPANSDVWNHNTSSYGTGGPFPTSNPNVPPTNQPGFVFDFSVASGDISEGTDVYFNMLFGDYDVSPASIKITSHDGTVKTLGVATQSGAADGLIQTAYTTLNFTDVFWGTGSAGEHLGYLEVDFVANNEPYTAFDFVELSVDPIPPELPVPEPTTMLLLGSGLIGLAGFRKRFRKQN